MGRNYKYTGQKFEEDFLKSIPDDIFSVKLKTLGRGFANVNNICDLLAYKHPQLYLLELKKTNNPSLPFSNIRENQYYGLLKANKIDGVTAGFIINFHRYEETFFLDIEQAREFIEGSDRKSFPYTYIKANGLLVPQQIKISRYNYDTAPIFK